MKKIYGLTGVWIVLCLLMNPSMHAWGALGGGVKSITQDQHALGSGATLSGPVVEDGYSVYTINTDLNHQVREFLSPAGKVFAVSCSGLYHHCDLSIVLNDYYREKYQNESKDLHGSTTSFSTHDTHAGTFRLKKRKSSRALAESMRS